MIPVRLVLENFLSYAHPEPLEFDGFDVACLSGSNGAGKSALLDAMTFSLYGAARGCEGGIHQERLIRDGADEMHVEFTFSLQGVPYRITRHRTRAGKGEIHFAVADGDDWRNIAGENLRETEAKIASVLRMDYKTFTASAFFVQGRSEDFLARMTPNERKEVFARLLDLEAYERVEEAARAKARDAENRRKEFERRTEELTGRLVDVEAIDREITDAKKQHAEVSGELETTVTEVDAARAAVTDLEKDEALLEREREALTALEKDASDASGSLGAKTNDLAEIDKLLARADEVSEAVAEMSTLRTSDENAREAQEAAAALDVKRTEVVAAIESERRSIAERHEVLARAIDQHKRELNELVAAATQISKIDEQLEAMSALAAMLEDARSQLRAHELDGARLQEQLTALEQKLETSNESMQVLAAGGGECPVCGSPLDVKHRAQAKRRLTAEAKATKTEIQTAHAALDTEKKETKRFSEEVRRFVAASAERETLVATREGLSVKIQRKATLEEELSTRIAEANDIEARSRDELFAVDLRKELAAIELNISQVYDADEHRRIRERMGALEPYAALAGRIEEAGRSRLSISSEIEASVARLEELNAAIASKREDVERETERISALAGTRKTLAGAETRLAERRGALTELTTTIARLEERIEGAKRMADEIEAARAGERDSATEHRRYRRLVEAFGRGGIPDRIIDNALPELEDDANRTLGRLSDHEMSVHFVLQRDTKSGKARDTFEALVHHDGGVRDFAMFSGGEAFRVAFAVRLAMSKLLVRRSGARLETLVIDEGFGTQDPQGRERLIEAVNLARSEFGKVLVITHLDDLKDQFGAQIVVSKGPEGSLLEVSPG